MHRACSSFECFILIFIPWNAWNGHSGRFMVDTGISYSAIWSLDLMSVEWQATMTSQPIRLFPNFLTFIPSLTFNQLRVVFIEHRGYPISGNGTYVIDTELHFHWITSQWFSLSIEVTGPRVNGSLIWWSSHINPLFWERHWKPRQNDDSYSPNWRISTYVIDLSPKSGHVAFHSDILTSFVSVVRLRHCFAGPLIVMS